MASAPEPVLEGEAPVEATRRRRLTYWSGPARRFQPTSTEEFGERGRARRADQRAVEPRAAAAPAYEQFVAHRIVNNADLDLGPGDAGDRDAEMRDAASEIRRAVDRIDDPCRASFARWPGLALFADKPIAWKNLKQALRDERLRLAVHLGEEVLPALEADRERPVEESAPRHDAGLARDRLRCEQPHVHELSVFSHHISVKSGCRRRAQRRPDCRPGQ